jgi:hypothetical protein
MMGRLALCRYTSTFFALCIRNCRHETTTTLCSTPVMCAAPATCPHTIRLRAMFFRYRAAKGAPFAVGSARSTTQRRMCETVPELVACAADVGRMMWMSLWCASEICVAREKEGLRTPPPVSSMPSVGAALGSGFSSLGERRSRGVGANDEFVLDVSDVRVGARSFCVWASSAASEREIADAFLRVLNWNFRGGLNELRVVCSFSERALMA